ncbi:hypothetical protein SAMN05877809_103106 [Rhodobacter sp. JA431]|nr:hypothetical protein SAMN05877809_103106 [Rhodobacter sp. JA431]
MTKHKPIPAPATSDVPAQPSTIHLAQLAAFEADGTPCIICEGVPHPRPALALVSLGIGDVGCRVAVSFSLAGGSGGLQPVILGKIVAPLVPSPPPNLSGTPVSAEVDGREERLEITGEREIVLRCGKASITLTRAGKIVLRGTYISSRSSGMNRIKGGSVQLN